MESNNSLISKKFPDDRILLSVKATMLPELLPPRQGLIGILTVTDKRFFFYGKGHPANLSLTSMVKKSVTFRLRMN